MAIKAIIFDMDGLIFDTESVWKKAYKVANKKFHTHLSEKYRQKFCGIKEEECIKIMQEDHPALNAEEYRVFTYEYVTNEYETKGSKIKKGFLTLISYLKDNNIPTALVTGSKFCRITTLFGHHKVDYNKMFDVILSSENYKNGKPHPEPYLLASEKLGISPNECLVLEDSSNGIISANKAGCKSIMVVDLIKPTKEVANMCLKVVRNLESVKKYLLKNL